MTTTMRRAGAAVAAAAMVLSAGCGGDDGTTTTAAAPRPDAHGAYVAERGGRAPMEALQESVEAVLAHGGNPFGAPAGTKVAGLRCAAGTGQPGTAGRSCTFTGAGSTTRYGIAVSTEADGTLRWAVYEAATTSSTSPSG